MLQNFLFTAGYSAWIDVTKLFIYRRLLSMDRCYKTFYLPQVTQHGCRVPVQESVADRLLQEVQLAAHGNNALDVFRIKYKVYVIFFLI
jgi:hypothetical protein